MAKKMLNIVIRKIRMTSRTRYHLIPIMMAIIKNQKMSSVGEGVGKPEAAYTGDRNVKRCRCHGKWCRHSSKS